MKHGHRLLTIGLILAILAMLPILIAAGDQPSLAADGIIYVDAEATGPVYNGNSWGTAFAGLQAALDVVGSGQQIWVAAGTYTPTLPFEPEDDRTASFQMANGVAIYGGFDPSTGDTEWEDRDWTVNETILSGDLGGNDGPDFANNDENSYHVFHNTGNLDDTAILDGFTITGGNADGYDPDHRGGGMHNYASSPTLTNLTFESNSALQAGGGMLNISDSAPTLTNCTFEGNSSNLGGGMHNDDVSSPSLTDCTFEGNSAYRGGGMFNWDDSSPALTHCYFTENSASFGGGMANSHSSPELANCTFSGNSASGNGGGVHNDMSSPTLTDCTFSGNSGSEGGAMRNVESSPVLSNCTFEDNSATFGGGMYNSGSSPELSDCTFSGNYGVFSAGGMDNRSSSPDLTNCTFEGNLSLAMYNADSSPTLFNCTFFGNMGAAVYNRGGSTPILTNCTLSGNSDGYYAAVHNDESSLSTLTNCILWGNVPGEIENWDAGSTAVVSYSDVQGGYEGEGNINEDPLFLDPDSGDLHLWVSSPCIDAGINVQGLPEFDFEGDARIVDGDRDGTDTVDMGVDESLWHPVYLPLVLKSY